VGTDDTASTAAAAAGQARIDVLRRLLAQSVDAPAARAEAQALLNYAAQTPGVTCVLKHDREDESVAAGALCLPGRTALLLLPPGPGADRDAARLAHCVQQLLDDLPLAEQHYVQALVNPLHAWQDELLTRLGFSRLARLSYRNRDASFPWLEPPGGQWRAYAPASEREFAAVIEETYVDSRDCPGLLGSRPMSDVLASHRASGRFDPQLWELLIEDGRPAGVILVSRVFSGSDTEVVYMGVCPAFRRRGVGRQLLARGLHLSRCVGARNVTLVLDASNDAAAHLYARLGFVEFAQRAAWWKRGPGGTTGG
jgi:GNAT superfamily N-acetyltransferase